MHDELPGISTDAEYVIEHLPALVAVCHGPDHVFVYANASYHQAVGHRPLLGRPFLEALPELEPQGYGQLLDEVLATGEPRTRHQEAARLARGPAGEVEVAYFDFTVAPLPRQGPPEAVLIQGVEVTESVRARRRADEAQAQLAALLADAPIGLAIFDHDGRFVVLNEEMARINGLSVDDHLGHSVDELLGEMGEGQLEIIRTVLRTGEPARDLRVVGETPADPGVERQWTVNYYPVVVAGRTVAVGATCAEVTHLLRLQSELDEAHRRESEDRFRRAVDNLHDSVAILRPERDDHGRVVDFRIGYVNQSVQEVGGRTADQLVGMTMLQAWPALGVDELMDEYVATFETGVPTVVEAFEYDDVVDGRPVWGVYDLRATRLGDELFVAWRDITDRVRRDRALVDSRVELERQRMAVEVLQGVVQPTDLPERPGFEVATLYLPATDVARVGGDWYDHFELDDGRLVMTIGDVAGHGLAAAQMMGHLRNAARVAALVDPGPLPVVRLLDRVASRDPIGRFATATYLVLDPSTGELCWLSAGHLPFAVQDPSGEWSLSEPCAAPPLGCGIMPESVPVSHSVLPPGGALLFFTDGLVERRTESIDDSLARLLDVLGRVDGPGGAAFCRRVADACLEGWRLDDDVCVLLVRRTA